MLTTLPPIAYKTHLTNIAISIYSCKHHRMTWESHRTTHGQPSSVRNTVEDDDGEAWMNKMKNHFIQVRMSINIVAISELRQCLGFVYILPNKLFQNAMFCTALIVPRL